MEFKLDKETYSQVEVSELLKTHIATETKALNEEIAKLTPVTKTDKELEIEQKYKDLAIKEKEINCKQYGIPNEISDYLSKDADYEKIGMFLKEQQGGYIPQNHKTTDAISKQDYEKLSYSQRAKLYLENPELIKTFL